MARRGTTWNDNAVTSPIIGMDAVTPDNTNPLPGGVCRAIWIGVTGDVNVIAADDTAAVVLKAVPAGQWIAVRAKQILATSTTATNIVAGY